MINLIDGDIYECEIPKEVLYFADKENNYIIKSYNKVTINYVGYLEYYKGSELVQLFSFPKNYNIDYDNIDNQRKQIIHSILKSNIGSNEECNESINNIIYIQNIINYYHKFGLYTETHKVHKTNDTGKINFAKTIKKKLPYQSGNNHVYHDYIISKKLVKHNYITDAMCYVINYASDKYSFYFDKVIIDYKVNNKEFSDPTKVIHKLKEILRSTFKDEEKHLVTNLIYYFENRANTNYNSLSICTTNYEHTYESMVHNALNSIDNHKFIKEDYNICDNNSHIIGIDHIDEVNKIIVDSKYYVNDITKVDYKQLFYLQHISSNLKMDSFIERKKELNKWVNVLITPNNDYIEPTSIVKRTSIDGLNLYTHQISINDLIHHYYSYNDVLVSKINSGIDLMRKLNMEN